MRFSVKTLLAVTAVIAATVASTLYPVLLVAGAYFFTALVTILMAIVAAVQLPASRRAFAVGYAVFAGGYLWIATPDTKLQQVLSQVDGPRAATLEAPLLTTGLLYVWYDLIKPGLASESTSGGWPAYPLHGVRGRPPAEPKLASATLLLPNRFAFLSIGHSAFAMALGCFGGAFGQRLWKGAAAERTAS